MDFTAIRRTTAFALLVLLLAAATTLGSFFKSTGFSDANEWIFAFCLTQTILLAFWAVYGPGSILVRLPFVAAWGLAVGFALARLNLISILGRASLAAGGTLVAAGMLSPLIIFALHRWRTRALVSIVRSNSRRPLQSARQLSLRALMILTAAFAVTAVVARSAITAPPDPFGIAHDTLVVQMWIGFYPCLVAAPVLLVIFRPSWKILLAGLHGAVAGSMDSFVFSLAAPFLLQDKSFAPQLSGEPLLETTGASLLWHSIFVIATIIYGLLARAAGFRMIVPAQSNDKNPNPSGKPSTEAGCVQD